MANPNRPFFPSSTTTPFATPISSTQFQMQNNVITALDAQMQNLNAQVEALNTRLHNLSSRVDAVTNQLRATTAALTSITAQNAQLQAATSALATQITQLEQHPAAATGPQPSSSSEQDLASRLQALEERDVHLTARRREAVTQLFNLRTLNTEAANAFQLRAADIQEDDLEGMVIAWATSMTTTHNHHQYSVANMRTQLQTLARGNPTAGGPPADFAYPQHYNVHGYCHAHNWPYPCRYCGN